MVVGAPWLSVSEYAGLVGISEQAARKHARHPQKLALHVRSSRGRGGASGIRHEIALSSLSEALQRRFREELGGEPCDDGGAYFQGPAPAIGCGYRPAPNQGETIEYRWRVIQEAVEAAPRSTERKTEVERAAKKWGEPVRTIYRWIERLEASGGDVNALARKLPADAGQRRVWKPPKPYSGSFDEFAMEADERIEVFEHQEINSGPFKGKTPAGIFADQVASGWRPVTVNTLALEAAFAKRETRLVDRGSVSIGGKLYRHPELPNRQEVAVALPYQRGSTPLVLLPEFGWAVLQADMPYLPGDIAGAKDSGRMQTRDDRAVRTKRKQLAPIDGKAILAANVTALPTRAAPAPLIDLDMSEQAKSFAGARIEAARIEAERPSAAEAEQRRIDAETRRLERKYGAF